MAGHVSDIQLAGLIDETLDEAEKTTVERHLDSCQDCLQRLAAHGDELARQLAWDDLRSADPSDVDAELAGRIRRALEGQLATPPPRETSVTTDLEFVRSLDRGGLGQVFEFRDRQFGRAVAVKLLQDRWSQVPAVVQRFRREMELTARIDNPGCPAVYGSGRTSDGREFFWMQLISGPILEEVLHQFHEPRTRNIRRSNPQFRRLLDIFRQICQTIEAAHERDILHRDLKPANIRVHRDGHPVVLDWGLAKQLGTADLETDSRGIGDTALTQDGATYGTLLYMSPEQARGERETVGKPTDIYGLGAVLYELLTGRPPHQSLAQQQPDHEALAAAIGRGALPSFADVPPELASICRKALAHEPHRRYAHAADLAADVERWLAGDPVSAHPYRLSGRTALAIRKRPLTSLAAGLATLVLVAAGLGMSHLAALAATERSVADDRFSLALEAHRALIQEVQAELAAEGRTGRARQRLLERAIVGIEQLVARAAGQPGAELAVLEGRLELAHLERRERANPRAALPLYQAVRQQLEGISPRGRQEVTYYKLLGDARKGVAHCQLETEGLTAARPHFDALHREAQRFYDEFPGEPSAAMLLSQSHVWQARLEESSTVTEIGRAEAHYQAARQLLDAVTAPPARQDDYAYEKLIAIAGLAGLRAKQEQWEEAIALQQQSVEEMVRLVRRTPSRKNRLGLVQDRMNLGVYQKNSGDPAAAIPTLSATLEEAQTLFDDFSDDHSIGETVEDARHNLATAYRAAGDPGRAIEVLAPLVRDDLELEGATLAVVIGSAQSRGALARAYEDSGRPADACAQYLKMVELRRVVLERDPEDLRNQHELLVAARKCGQLAAGTSWLSAARDALSDLCRRVEQESVESWPSELRNELAGVYFFLGSLHWSDAPQAPAVAAARESYTRARSLLATLEQVAPGLLAELERRIKACEEALDGPVK